MTDSILLTGASGFVGSRVRAHLDEAGVPFHCLLRRGGSSLRGVVGTREPFVVDAFDEEADYGPALEGACAVIHCAGRAHVADEDPLRALDAHRRVNRDGTLALARASRDAGVRRFVFVSTIGVCGQATRGAPFRAEDVAPRGAYAVSKYEAERGLLEESGPSMGVVIVRPPLVYGPRPPGNLGRIVEALRHHRPIPLGLVGTNRRSLLGADNLALALIRSAQAPAAAAGRAYTLADEGVVSTRRIVTLLAEGLGVTPLLVPVPVSILRSGASLLGRRGIVEKLVGDLVVETTEFARATGWCPVNGLEEGLRAAGAGSR